MFGKTKKIHLVGIGGSGMSGIAEVLLTMGYEVSGTDARKSAVTERLESLGSSIGIGHDPSAVREADVVVISSAIPRDNVEVVEAERLGIPVIPRAEMLGELMRMKYGIAVGGSHGKTTTTSLIAEVLSQGGLDPTVVVGGRIKVLGTGAKLGKGDYLVAEADESDGSFMTLVPALAVVTSIDEEHMDYYEDLDAIKDAFVTFMNMVPFYGASIVCLDQSNVQSVLPRVKRRLISYGLTRQADVMGDEIESQGLKSTYTLRFGGRQLGKISISMPGLHNVYNSLAACAVGLELGVDFSAIKKALENFQGIGRRFEIKGEKKGIIVLDDYGHHPSEVETTLRAAQATWGGRVIVVFQPHRYSRTEKLHEMFGKCFYDADVLFLTDVYAAGEKPIEGVSSKLIYDSLVSFGHHNVTHLSDYGEIVDHVVEVARPGDVIVTLGAGDVHELCARILEKL
jgi:UDP-N-acetylmuramate--alanine ligase